MVMEKWVINNDIVSRHAIGKSHLSTLRAISLRDYASKDYFPEPPQINALDLDEYERSQTSGRMQPSCTGDSIIGIAKNYDRHKGFLSPSLLFIELRMNYTHGDAVSLTELQKKVAHSIELVCDGTCLLHNKYYFVFTDTVAPQVKYLISQRIRQQGRFKDYVAVSVTEMRSILIDPSTIPYIPKNSKESIEKSLLPLFVGISKWQVDKISKQLDQWTKILQSYAKTYDIQEVEYLLSVLEPILTQLYANASFLLLCADEQILLELQGEEIRRFANYVPK